MTGWHAQHDIQVIYCWHCLCIGLIFICTYVGHFSCAFLWLCTRIIFFLKVTTNENFMHISALELLGNCWISVCNMKKARCGPSHIEAVCVMVTPLLCGVVRFWEQFTHHSASLWYVASSTICHSQPFPRIVSQIILWPSSSSWPWGTLLKLVNTTLSLLINPSLWVVYDQPCFWCNLAVMALELPQNTYINFQVNLCFIKVNCILALLICMCCQS